MYNALFFIHYTSFFDMFINNSMSFIIQLEIYIKIPINNTVQSSKLNQIVSVIHLTFLTMTNFSYSLILIVLTWTYKIYAYTVYLYSVPSNCFHHFLVIFNEHKHTCQRSTIQIHKRGKILGLFIDTLSVFSFILWEFLFSYWILIFIGK